MMLSWGSKTSLAFCVSVVQICNRLGIDDPSWLMACMAFETGESFSPSICNAAGSGAVGLIQFMPSTATALGVTVEALKEMLPEEQLIYVERYFKYLSGRLHSLGDVYGAIIWPGMIGKTDDYVVFDSEDPNHPKRYLQNRGLDLNSDGVITRAEVVKRVQDKLTRGYNFARQLPDETYAAQV